MAVFPKTIETISSYTAMTGSQANKDFDPNNIFVQVFVPAHGVAIPDVAVAPEYYRLSDLINYIVSTAKGQ